jgi:PTS system ascorbate-specific IIA component
MTVGLLLITHNGIGDEILSTAMAMMGTAPLPVDTLKVVSGADPDALADQGRRLVSRLDTGDGVLVLTDAYGSTPSNIANRLGGSGQVQVVAGINLPMLVRVMNYAQLPLAQLAAKALSGGRDGVLLCNDGDEALD